MITYSKDDFRLDFSTLTAAQIRERAPDAILRYLDISVVATFTQLCGFFNAHRTKTTDNRDADRALDAVLQRLRRSKKIEFVRKGWRLVKQ